MHDIVLWSRTEHPHKSLRKLSRHDITKRHQKLLAMPTRLFGGVIKVFACQVVSLLVVEQNSFLLL